MYNQNKRWNLLILILLKKITIVAVSFSVERLIVVVFIITIGMSYSNKDDCDWLSYSLFCTCNKIPTMFLQSCSFNETFNLSIFFLGHPDKSKTWHSSSRSKKLLPAYQLVFVSLSSRQMHCVLCSLTFTALTCTAVNRHTVFYYYY